MRLQRQSDLIYNAREEVGVKIEHRVDECEVSNQDTVKGSVIASEEDAICEEQ